MEAPEPETPLRPPRITWRQKAPTETPAGWTLKVYDRPASRMRVLKAYRKDFGDEQEALQYLEDMRRTYIAEQDAHQAELAAKKAEYKEKVATLKAAAKRLQIEQRPAGMPGKVGNYNGRGRRVAEDAVRKAEADAKRAQEDLEATQHAPPPDAIPPRPTLSGPLMKAIDSIRVRQKAELTLDPRTGNSAALFGSSKSGKTTCMMQLYRRYFAGKDYIATLFAQNIQIGAYGSHSKLLRCGNFDAPAMKYIRLQKAVQTRTRNEYRFVNLIDDFINVRYNDMINNLVLTYRNSDISTLICLQSAKLLSKAARSSVNNILLFGCNLAEGRLDLMRTFLRPYLLEMGLKSDDDMMYFYKHCTAGHGYIQLHPASGAIAFYRLSVD